MPRPLCLLVADRYTHSILRFDAEDDTFIDEFVPPSAELAFPMSVAVRPQGDIYAPSSGIFFLLRHQKLWESCAFVEPTESLPGIRAAYRA